MGEQRLLVTDRFVCGGKPFSNGLYVFWGKPAGKTDKNPELLFIKPEKNWKSFHWGIALNENDKVIGEAWIYLIKNNRMAKTALRIAPIHQNQGIATEAMKTIIDDIIISYLC